MPSIDELYGFLIETADKKQLKKEQKDYLKYLKNIKKEVEFHLKTNFADIGEGYVVEATRTHDVDLCILVGMMYQYGAFVKQNFTRALSFYKFAEMQDNAEGAYGCAILYLKGLGDGRDFKKFLIYCKKAMDLGDSNAKEQWDSIVSAYNLYYGL